MKKQFALEHGGPKRLTVTYDWKLAGAEVLLDGTKVASFATKEEFQRGTTFKLPDGSIASVRFGPVVGAPFLKGIHVIRNGAPLPGSAADPVPMWAWPFMIACAAIPVISLGGALPAVIAAAGVGGTMSVSRASRWSIAMRAGACALIVLACWGAFGALVVSIRGTESVSTFFMSSSPEKLLNEMEATYTKQGFQEEYTTKMMERWRSQCYSMNKKECVDYLRTSLYKIKNTHYTD